VSQEDCAQQSSQIKHGSSCFAAFWKNVARIARSLRCLQKAEVMANLEILGQIAGVYEGGHGGLPSQVIYGLVAHGVLKFKATRILST